MYIDGDTHFWPLKMIDRVDHPGKGYLEIKEDAGNFLTPRGEPYAGRTATFYRDGKLVHTIKEPRWNLEERYVWMDRDGFDKQVLIADNRPLLYELEPDLGRQMARAYNDSAAEAIQGKEDRFIGVSWVYLPDVEEAIREVRRAANDLGLRAVKLMGGWGNVDLDSQELWPFYEAVAELDIPILVHPAARGSAAAHSADWLVGGERFQGYQMLPTSLGFPFTYMTAAARLIFSGTLDRFPTVNFAFFEGCVGWVPWLMTTLEAHMPDVGAVGPDSTRKAFFKDREMLKRRPAEYFSQLYIAAAAWEKAYLADTVRGWPNHRIIIGSDFDHGDAVGTWPNTIKPILDIPDMSDEDKDLILGGNLARLFKIEDTAGARSARQVATAS